MELLRTFAVLQSELHIQQLPLKGNCLVLGADVLLTCRTPDLLEIVMQENGWKFTYAYS